MRKILFVSTSLDYTGLGRRLLLAAALPRDRFDLRVLVLGGESPWADAVREAGAAVEVLPWKRPSDLLPFLALPQRLADLRPDVVHAWGLPAAWAAFLAGMRPLPRAGRPVVSGPVGDAAGRWLFRRAGRVAAFGRAEADAHRRAGVADSRLVELPLAVALPPSPQAPPALPGLPAEARVIACLGPVVRGRGFREAVWTMDILKPIYPDLHLVVVGACPDAGHARDLARGLKNAERIHFTGACPRPGDWLARAELAWVPRPSCRSNGGTSAALEAQALGIPVIASRLPQLEEVVADGETGLLVNPGDKADLSRKTRRLLDDPALRGQMGEQGRRRVRQKFDPARLAEEAARFYGAFEA